MSLFAAVASAALTVVGHPVHNVELEHRGESYQVAYRPVVETRLRTVGMAAGTRPSSERCVISAQVSVERAIAAAQDGPALKAMLPGETSFTRNLPGSCHGRAQEGAKLVASRSKAVGAHLSRVAATDRTAAIAAIESAHHFAAN
jgi:hypothetical protein